MVQNDVVEGSGFDHRQVMLENYCKHSLVGIWNVLGNSRQCMFVNLFVRYKAFDMGFITIKAYLQYISEFDKNLFKPHWPIYKSCKNINYRIVILFFKKFICTSKLFPFHKIICDSLKLTRNNKLNCHHDAVTWCEVKYNFHTNKGTCFYILTFNKIMYPQINGVEFNETA